MSRARWTLPCLALVALGLAAAPAVAEPRPAKPTPAAKAHKRSHKKPRPGSPIAAYPGFRMLDDGRSRVFVELSASVPVEERRAQGTLTYILKGARIAARNNRNALIPTAFETPVSRARLVPVDDDVELVVELRADSIPAYRMTALEGGRAALEIDFPEGKFAKEGDSEPVAQPRDADAGAMPDETTETAPKGHGKGGSSHGHGAGPNP